jgi:hypothetical protein
VALTLSVLLYCYSLIMGTSDQALPWALKIMMIALVTVAVFIYRKPFQHLFSSVGYGMLGADQRAQVSLRESTFGFRRVTSTAASVVAPSVGGARATRFARRPADATVAAGGTGTGAAADAAGGVSATGAAMPDAATGASAPEAQGGTRQWPGASVRAGGRAAPPLPPRTSADGSHGGPPSTGAPSAGWARGGGGGEVAGTGTHASTPPPARGPAPSPVRQGPPTPSPVRQGPPPSPARPSSPASSPRPAAPRPSAPPPSPPPAPRPASTSRWPSGAAPLRSGDSTTGTAAQPPKPPAASPFWARSRRRSK